MIRDEKWCRFKAMEKTELATKLREKLDEGDTVTKCFMRMGEMDRSSKEDGKYGENNRTLLLVILSAKLPVASSFATILNLCVTPLPFEPFMKTRRSLN